VVGLFFRSNTRDVAAFSILIVVLIFLPTGLLGRPEVEKSLTGRARDRTHARARAGVAAAPALPSSSRKP